MASDGGFDTDFNIGPSVIASYSRLSYTMWYALAEFLDNSTQSVGNYRDEIGPVLDQEDTPLVVQILHDKLNKTLSISDNSIGMSRQTLIDALRVAQPTPDSRGRSKYGMGLKTAACWIGNKWEVITTRLGQDIEYRATVDVEAVSKGARIPVAARSVGLGEHYTTVLISDLNRSIGRRTEENIREYLGSMYRFDLREGLLRILFNDELISPPDDQRFDTDPSGGLYKRSITRLEIGDKVVTGWVGVLKEGSGGRKYGGFSIFQNRRMIQGFPNAWKPKTIFGGVESEGANNLLAQRLTGVLELDGFDVSHTKDAILYRNNEQEELEKHLFEQSRDFIDFARRRRGTRGEPFNRERVVEMIEDFRAELQTPEIRDAIMDALPPIETIQANNARLVEGLGSDEDATVDIDIVEGLRIQVTLTETSEFEPYLTIMPGAEYGVLYVIVNNLHPYYGDIASPDAKSECLKQYIYDAVAEYRVSQQYGQLNPDSIRRKKDSLLRARREHINNLAEAAQRSSFSDVVDEPS